VPGGSVDQSRIDACKALHSGRQIYTVCTFAFFVKKECFTSLLVVHISSSCGQDPLVLVMKFGTRDVSDDGQG